MKNKTLLIMTMMMVLSIFIFGCENTSKNEDESDTDTSGLAIGDEQKSFYLVPSPEDLFDFSNDTKLIFNPEVLNSTDNIEKYIDNKSKELNFGVYAADLAYCAAFSKNQETVKYLHIVRSISDKIGISAAFDESLIKRIENIDDNKDSLKTVSSDTYYDIVRFLEANKKNETLCMISVGGWLESLYLVTSLVDKYDAKSTTIQRIADQKIIFANLIQYLEQNEEIANVKTILELIQPINQIFSELEVGTSEPSKASTNENVISVGGNAKIMITEAQFKNLKETIAKVRNNITANNVTL